MSQYQDEILKDLAELVAIPSVCKEPLPGKPFGEASAQALECILSMAQRMGFETDNTGNYAGAAIVSLYCLKALKDAGIQGKYVLRTVFGCGEEIASNDLDCFYAQHPYPVMGFTPDCGYGICQSEKGILRIDFHTKNGQGTCVKAFQAGLAVNAVPAKATAEISCTEEQHQKLTAAADPEHFQLTREGSVTTILSLGIAAHGAEPSLGFNAASNLIRLLCAVFTPKETGDLIAFLNRHIGMEWDGKSLGIQMSDEPSGDLTLNLGILELDEKAAHASVDIRYPVTKDYRFIFETAEKMAKDFHLDASIQNHTAPLYIPEDYPLIQRLKEAYESATGESCSLYSTGGGTYARHTNNRAVGFGPGLPGSVKSNAHSCNECIDLEHFFLHAQICLEAMYLLFTK